MAELRGIDVSQAQGVIDWKKVKASGQVDFAIIRSSYGWSTDLEKQIDKQFMNNVKGCEENGIPYGIYHYSYCVKPENAEKEAKYFLEVIKDANPTYPVFFDIEDPSHQKLNWQQLTSITATFCYVVEKWGYRAGIYSYKNFLESKLNMNALKQYELWVAQIADKCTYDGDFGMWQHSWNGRIDGITGAVDLNICYKDYESWIKNHGKNEKRYSVEEDVSIIKNPQWVDVEDLEFVKNNDITVVERDNKTASSVTLIHADMTLLNDSKAIERKMRDNHIEHMRKLGYIPKGEQK